MFIQIHPLKVSSPLVNLFNKTTDLLAFMMIQEHIYKNSINCESGVLTYIIHEGKKSKLLSNQTKGYL